LLKADPNTLNQSMTEINTMGLVESGMGKYARGGPNAFRFQVHNKEVHIIEY